ncbi:hypothetical protein Hanom_Chr13g01201421 [Helianthus anomalus]
MRYGGVWVGTWVKTLVDMWNRPPPPPPPPPPSTTTQIHAHRVWWGLGLGHEFGLAIESLPCHLLARLTPGFKPTPMGPRPKPTSQPKPPGWRLGRFLPIHAPTQAPYPMA